MLVRKGSTNLLDVVVGKRAAILKLLAGENQALLVRGNSLLVLDLCLNIVDCVRGLNLQGDGLARQGLHEAVCPRQLWFVLGWHHRSRVRSLI